MIVLERSQAQPLKKEIVMQNPFVARQGDVLVVMVSCIPDGVTEVARDHGRVVLAYGEVTGHAHALAEPAHEYMPVVES